MSKEELKKIVQQLIALGEDPDELNFWIDIYDLMEEQTRAELSENLKQELETLSRMKPPQAHG